VAAELSRVFAAQLQHSDARGVDDGDRREVHVDRVRASVAEEVDDPLVQPMGVRFHQSAGQIDVCPLRLAGRPDVDGQRRFADERVTDLRQHAKPPAMTKVEAPSLLKAYDRISISGPIKREM
jgi:hypothetical protein